MKKNEGAAASGRTVEDQIAEAVYAALRGEVGKVAEALRGAGPVLSPRLLSESAERLLRVAKFAERFPSVFQNGAGAVVVASEPKAEEPEKREPESRVVELGRKVIRLRETKTWAQVSKALKVSASQARYARRMAAASAEA